MLDSSHTKWKYPSREDVQTVEPERLSIHNGHVKELVSCLQLYSLVAKFKTWSKRMWILYQLRVTNLNGLPHSLLSYGHLIPGERACTGRTCLIKKFFQGPSKGRYIPWAVPEDSGYWLNGVLRGWSANG